MDATKKILFSEHKRKAVVLSVTLVFLLSSFFGVVTGNDQRYVPSQPSVSIEISTSRVSGIGPLSVHFNAIGDLDWSVIESLDFSWDFDSDGNEDFNGYLAAHVFEYQPEPYIVTLTVRNADGYMIEATEMITVIDPDIYYTGTNTICFSTDADFSGSPSGAEQITTTSWDTIKNYFTDDTRILLKRGDEWTVDLTHIAALDTFTLGAFGLGENPKLHRSAYGNLFLVFPENIDIRFMDLDIDGTLCCPDNDNKKNVFKFTGDSSSTQFEDFLLYRVHIHQFDSGVMFEGDVGPGQNLMVKDCIIDDTNFYGFYINNVDNVALLDSTISHTAHVNEHGFRACSGQYMLVNGVSFENNERSNLALRGGSYWLVCDSYFGKSTHSAPGDTTKIQGCVYPEEGDVDYVMFDSNYFNEHHLSNIIGDDVIVRNNIFYYGKGMSISSSYAESTKIYNNVQYWPTWSEYFISIWDGSGIVETANNIYSAEHFYNLNPYAQPPTSMLTNLPASEVNFIDVDNPENGGLALEEGSAGIDEGTPLSCVLRDYDGNWRPDAAPLDIGAYEVTGDEGAEFVITSIAGPCGATDPEGDIIVEAGESLTVYMNPDRGFIIVNVLINGESVGAVSEYTFEDISADATLQAAFIYNVVGDIDCNGRVDVTDLIILLNEWGPVDPDSPFAADLNGDWVVDIADFTILHDHWGSFKLFR